MWVAYSNKGTRIERDFWDWTCMNKIITDYMEECGMTRDEAYKKFWEDVRNYDTEDYEDILDGRTFDEALGNGYLDEIRADYLRSLNIDCEKIADSTENLSMKKYSVVIHYEGGRHFVVEAENEDKAIEFAEEKFGKLTAEELVENIADVFVDGSWEI